MTYRACMEPLGSPYKQTIGTPQHLQKMWCDEVLKGKDMSDLAMIKTTWRSTNGRGTIECSNQATIDWVVKAISGISIMVKGQDGEPDKVKTFKAWQKHELEELAFANVFLDMRFRLVTPMAAITSALQRLRIDSKGVSIVKSFRTTTGASKKETGLLVKLVMNNDLADKVKQYQEANGAILAGTGYVKFDFGKPDEQDTEASMDVPEEEIVPEADKEMEGFEDEDTSPGESIRKLFKE